MVTKREQNRFIQKIDGSATLMGTVKLLPVTFMTKSCVLIFFLLLVLSANVCWPGVNSPLQGASPASIPSTMTTISFGMFVVTVTIVTVGCCGGVGVLLMRGVSWRWVG